MDALAARAICRPILAQSVSPASFLARANQRAGRHLSTLCTSSLTQRRRNGIRDVHGM